MTLLPWGWAAKGSSPGRVIVGDGGAGPTDAFRNSWPLLALGHPGSRCLALASGDGGVDGDDTPQVSTSHNGTAILNLPVPLGSQPGTFGGSLLAPVSTVQPMSARCKHRRLASPRSRESAGDRRRPLLSTRDHPVQKCDSSHMRRGRQGPSAVPTASRPGSRRLATRVVIPRPHPGSRGTSKAPIEPESQASAESAATDASAAARPSAGGFQDACRPGARADGAHPDCAAESRSGAREAGRPGCWPRHRVARDRRPAGCDQAGGPSALPTPPSWQRDCSGATQLTIGKSSQCQRSSGADNICCRAPTGQQRCPIRRLASGNGREHGVDNGCCPIW